MSDVAAAARARLQSVAAHYDAIGWGLAADMTRDVADRADVMPEYCAAVAGGLEQKVAAREAESLAA